MSTVNNSIEVSSQQVSVSGQEYDLPIVSARSGLDQPEDRIVYLPGIGETGKGLIEIVSYISEETGRDVVAYTSRLAKILTKPWEQAGNVSGELFEQITEERAKNKKIDIVGASLAGLTVGSVLDRNNVEIKSATLVSPVMVATHSTVSKELRNYASTASFPGQIEAIKELESRWLKRTLEYIARFSILGANADIIAGIRNREPLAAPINMSRVMRDIGPGIHRAIPAFGVISNGSIIPQLDRAEKSGVELNFVIGRGDKPHPYHDFSNALSSIEQIHNIGTVAALGADHHAALSSIGGKVQLNKALASLAS